MENLKTLLLTATAFAAAFAVWIAIEMRSPMVFTVLDEVKGAREREQAAREHEEWRQWYRATFKTEPPEELAN